MTWIKGLKIVKKITGQNTRVVIPIMMTAVVLMPAKIKGSARGISTYLKI